MEEGTTPRRGSSGGDFVKTRTDRLAAAKETAFLAMTEAGKPVFYCATLRCEEGEGKRPGNGGEEEDEVQEDGLEEDVSRVCGLVRAICGSLEYGGLRMTEGPVEGDAMRWLQSDNKIVVLLSVGSLTLVAISHTGGSPRSGKGRRSSTVAYLRLQLEYAYGLVLATLTDHIQRRLALDPSYDLRLDLGHASENSIRSLLAESQAKPYPFLLSAVPTYFPLPPSLRESVSRVLKAAGESVPNTLLALIFAYSKLVTLVQPSYVTLSASDLLLLRHIVTRQHAEADQRLWIPVCLPRIHSSGYLHAYVHPLDGSKSHPPPHHHQQQLQQPRRHPRILLVLVSSVGSTDQFNAFRRVESYVRSCLGLAAHGAPSPGTLEILQDGNSESLSQSSLPAVGTGLRTTIDAAGDRDCGSRQNLDVAWRRVEDRRGSDEDYVDASGDGDRMIKYVPPEGEVVMQHGAAASSEDGTSSSWSLLSQIDASRRGPLTTDLLQSAGALHFVFRLDVPVADDIRHRGHHLPRVRSNGTSVLSQCISSPFLEPIATQAAKRSVWLAYQRLSLRLRFGSSAPEATHDALDRIALQLDPRESECCLAMKLAETSSSTERVSYVSEGGLTYLALNGAEFELYVVSGQVGCRNKASSM
jgi:hypothetical protein